MTNNTEDLPDNFSWRLKGAGSIAMVYQGARVPYKWEGTKLSPECDYNPSKLQSSPFSNSLIFDFKKYSRSILFQVHKFFEFKKLTVNPKIKSTRFIFSIYHPKNSHFSGFFIPLKHITLW
jgi:hypothetical protein